MGTLLNFLALGLTFGLANSGYVYDTSASAPASDDFINKQSKVFALFDHIYITPRHYDWYQVGMEYNIEANIAQYNKPKLIRNFLSIYNSGILIRKQPFSIFIHEHFVQAKSLFELFYYAKDFDTFYKSAAFARIHVNEGMFVYALTVALLHRPDTKGLILPAPYEINPYYFAAEESISKIQGINCYANFNSGATKSVGNFLGIDYDEALKSYIVYANYSGSYGYYNEEETLSYYTEDVGLNAYYYYFQADYPFWLGGDEYGLKNDRRGELFYYFYQQMLARYYLERRSNGLGDIPDFSWYQPIETGYDSNLRYYLGYSFPSRPNYYYLKNIPYVQNELNYVTDYESYLSNIIDAGFYKTKDGKIYNLTKPESIEFLGNYVQHNPDFYQKVNFPYQSYEYNARFLLGAARVPYDSNYAVPSALQQYETSARDPIFYQFYKRLLGYFFKFKSALTPYTASELHFTGVNVNGVEVDKLVTYFDYFDYDATRGAIYSPDVVANLPYWFKIRQPRLAHKPFNIKVKVTSNSAVKSVVKFFLGPKYDNNLNVYNLDENKYNFVELDNFVYELQSGENVIERNSAQFSQYSNDQTMFYNLFQRVQKGEKIPLDMSESHNGYPNRLMLPKGTKAGFPLVLYVIVYPYEAPPVAYGTGFNPIYQAGVGSGARYYDNKALGFPLDRPIDEYVFYQSNMYFKDVNVYQYDYENVFVYSQIYYYKKFNKVL